MGRDLSPEDQENIVRGRLLENVIIGTDKGVMSAKQLGADKRIAMWQPDSQVGMVILQAPPVLKIAHEVPWIETRAMKELQARERHKGKEEPVALTPVAEPRPQASREDEDVSYRQARAERH